MRYLKRHLSVANVLACLALFAALGGAAYAVSPLGKRSVKTQNLANGAVTTLKLRGGAVTTLKLRNGAVTGIKVAPGAIGSNQLADGGVRSADLGGSVITTAKLKDGAVSGEKLANNAVTSAKLAADAVTTGKLQDGVVTATKLSSSLSGQLVKNVSNVAKASASDNSDSKTVTAECPAGKQVTGGGAKLIGSVSKVALDQSAPFVSVDDKRTGWTAAAHEVETWNESWAVEAFAICAEF